MTVRCQDALELSAAEISACDVQITDFPYSPYVHANMMSTHTLASGGPARSDPGFEALTPEDRMQGAWAASLVKRWSVIFSDWQGAHLWDDEMVLAGVEPIRWIPWVRWSQAQISGDRPCTGSESVLVYHAMAPAKTERGKPKPIAKHWNGSGGLIQLNERCMRGSDKHRTQKPLDVMLTLVSAFSDPGERVLDLRAGSCTTAAACALLGRECLCIERNDRWSSYGAERERDALRGILNAGDLARANEWVQRTWEEATSVPDPKDESQLPTWERAQRRLADVDRVCGVASLGGPRR
jgi:hypothetical protein